MTQNVSPDRLVSACASQHDKPIKCVIVTRSEHNRAGAQQPLSLRTMPIIREKKIRTYPHYSATIGLLQVLKRIT